MTNTPTPAACGTFANCVHGSPHYCHKHGCREAESRRTPPTGQAQAALADRAQSDYAIALQRAIEAHCRGEKVPADVAALCPHHAAKLDATASTPQAQDQRALTDELQRLADKALLAARRDQRDLTPVSQQAAVDARIALLNAIREATRGWAAEVEPLQRKLREATTRHMNLLLDLDRFIKDEPTLCHFEEVVRLAEKFGAILASSAPVMDTRMSKIIEALEIGRDLADIDLTQRKEVYRGRGAHCWADEQEDLDKLTAALALARSMEKEQPRAWLRTSGTGSPVITEEFLQAVPQYRDDFTIPLYARPAAPTEGQTA